METGRHDGVDDDPDGDALQEGLGGGEFLLRRHHQSKDRILVKLPTDLGLVLYRAGRTCTHIRQEEGPETLHETSIKESIEGADYTRGLTHLDVLYWAIRTFP